MLYLFDTSIFRSCCIFYPRRFPTIWDKFDNLVAADSLISVKEVLRELDLNCQETFVFDWAKMNRKIFVIPREDELRFVAELMKNQEYRGLVKKTNILSGKPVADPFIIAVGKMRNAVVVTQEKDAGGARIPTICKAHKVQCINLEKFFEKEAVEY